MVYLGSMESILRLLFDTIVGAMLPLMVRTFEPAASDPAVATVADVSGLIICFSVAKVFMLGVLR